MHHSLHLSCALALEVLMLGGACAPKSPPALKTPQVQPIAVPMPAVPKDASLFGYLKVRNVRKTLELFRGTAVTAVADAKGLSLSELQPGKPAAFFVWDPQGANSPQTLPAAALLPAPAQGYLAERFASLWDSVRIEKVGEGVLAAMNPEVAERAQQGLPGLVEILNAELPFDGVLYIHLAAIFDKYMPILRQGLNGLGPALAASEPQTKGGPSPQATLGMIDGILTGFEALRAVAIGATPYDGGIEASVLLQDRSSHAGGPIAAPDLAQFLPPADVRVVWNSRDIKRTMDYFLRVYGPLLDEGPGLRAQVQALLDEWMQASRRLDSAMAFQFGGERAFRGQGILRADKAANLRQVLHKGLELFNQGPIHDAYKRMGVDLQIAYKPQVRKLKGFGVDRYEYSVKVSSALTDPMARAVWERFSGSSYEVTQMGAYLVYALNGSVDAVVSALYAGKGQNPMKALAVFPPGGHIYIDLHLQGLFAALKSLLPANLADKIPTLPPQPEPVTCFGYDGGETAYYKLRLPGPLLAALGSAAH